LSQPKPKLLIIMDWQPDKNWVFRKVLDEAFFTDICFGLAPKSFQSTFEKVYFLWKSYVAVAVRAFLKARKYDVIYSWHAVIGLVFASLCRVFRIDKPKIVVAQLIVPRKGDSLAQRMKIAFTRYALKRVDCVIVYSRVEVQQFKLDYSTSRTKFVFVPLGIDASEDASCSNGGYVFSGGRSNRDYYTLIAAMRGTAYTAHIAAQRFNIKGVHVPANVHPHFDAFGEKFKSLLSGAALVVIPLDRPDESSGQLVLLQAMSMGKAIIVTESRGIADYCVAGETAALVPQHDPQALRQSIQDFMNSDARREQMGKTAQEFAQKFTLQKQAKNIADLLINLI